MKGPAASAARRERVRPEPALASTLTGSCLGRSPGPERPRLVGDIPTVWCLLYACKGKLWGLLYGLPRGPEPALPVVAPPRPL